MSPNEHRRGSTLKESIDQQVYFLFHDTDLLDSSSSPEPTPVPAFSRDPKDPNSSFLHMEDSDDEDEDGSAVPLVYLPSPPATPPKVIPTLEAECFVLQPVPEHMKYRKRKRLALGMEVAPRPRASSRAPSGSKCTGPSFSARYSALANVDLGPPACAFCRLCPLYCLHP
ncbi:hypothetical protein L202_06800 [Cryptococcus amylolentus CBS 6039]|uniref:Uncharacterized protein n=2 Tax=Cryptococcus amylolentus TaxID=104669 RepID=A0A1E3HDJ0_9TREE|nr:hypothetical protein L202_06800 [Cryptococcus amylolentus CBS 6039]ODN74394.1 hypothetical protein L202_06800 [Cryptococcus amylolentus CBS 6039]ODO01407.1 hypothetical protein I350_06226 [Cryptococcus amylolentus CBS 6273]